MTDTPSTFTVLNQYEHQPHRNGEWAHPTRNTMTADEYASVIQHHPKLSPKERNTLKDKILKAETDAASRRPALPWGKPVPSQPRSAEQHAAHLLEFEHQPATLNWIHKQGHMQMTPMAYAKEIQALLPDLRPETQEALHRHFAGHPKPADMPTYPGQFDPTNTVIPTARIPMPSTQAARDVFAASQQGTSQAAQREQREQHAHNTRAALAAAAATHTTETTQRTLARAKTFLEWLTTQQEETKK